MVTLAAILLGLILGHASGVIAATLVLAALVSRPAPRRVPQRP